MRGKEILIFWFLVLSTVPARLFGANVTYDSRAILIDGKRRVLISGAIHYPRSTPDMWPDLFQKAKDGGLDAIETYVFWNLHEPAPNEYDFTGRKDLVKFVKLAAKAGLYVFLRIGPYVCAEINYGGFPVWLHYIPKIEFRTNNEPFKREMQRFTTIIVDMMKKEKLYASQGGPIILSQIENEYQYVESDFGSGGKDYIKWAASMALSLDTGVPWIMCHQEDAPDPIINTCNDFYCDQFTPNSPNKPKMWTENWTAWPLFFGGAEPYRPAEDVAFAVARFYQRGGTLQNYYMYHGGTNFGRTSGGPFISTSYDYDAPIDEYGLVRQPKWGHLKDLHKAIKLCEPAMVACDPAITSLGSNLEASVYKTESGLCAAFLANVDAQSDATVNFNGNTYHLPAWSVSILPDCKNVVMNTAQINSEVTIPKFMRQSSSDNADCSQAFQSGWSWFNEPIDISNSYAFAEPELLEQINTTADKSDYLWYSVSISIEGNETFLQNGFQTALHIESNGHALHAFVNGKLAGSGKGNSSNAEFAIEVPITLVPGRNSIDLLSLTVGLKNFGALLERSPAGVKKVRLEGVNNGSTLDLSWQLWRYQIGLKGEELGLPYGGTSIFWKKRKHSPSVWISEPTLAKKQPLVWYKSKFDAPSGQDPVALDFTGMGKGEAWVNGQSIGRYWPTNTAPEDGCTDSCDYRGRYGSTKCLKNCGKPSQQFYHVPRSWLKRSGNTLVLFEEMGGDPTQISFARRQIESLCSIISETYPPPVEMWNIDQRTGNSSGPTLSLKCPSPKQVISYIKFASFGTPQGTCGNFSHGSCSSPKAKALSIVQKACIGKKSCSIEVSINTFGNPCSGVTKSLAVEATCK